jgi:AAA domain, putative AbiEii toxin, Type IV TA system
VLERIRLTNFKSFADEVLTKGSRGGVTTWPGIRGGAREIAHEGSDSFTLETTWCPRNLVADGKGGPFAPRTLPDGMTHRLTCQVNGGAKLLHERLSMKGEEEALFETGAVEELGIKVVRAGGPDSWMPPKMSVLGLTDNVWLRGEMRYTLFQELRPSAMRGWGDVNAPFGTEGENFAGRLAAHLAEHPSTRLTVVDWLRELCAPEIEDLDFIRSEELGEVMLVLVEKGGRRVSARSISDGTLRFLGLFVALNLLDSPPVIVVEEIDTGLHPTRLRALVELLEQVPRERPIQIIATTHSPTLLQWLSPEALRDVVVFGRAPDREGTIMRRLGDLDRFDEVLKHDRIDELFSTGWMEMAL